MLVERDAELDRLGRLAEAAVVHRRGALVFVGGEAGIGKTTLVDAAAAAVTERWPQVRRLRGVADNVTAAAPLGVMVDALPDLLDLLGAASTMTRQALFTAIRGRLADPPTLLILEDVHWADEASLDLLRFVGRRLDDVPLLILATFRTEEAGGTRPLAVVLGDLAGSPTTRRLDLSPLSADGVAALVRAAGSAVDVAALTDRTAGVPFFVTEVLAAGDDRIPATVRDAVLARAARLSPGAQDVLAAAAVIGRPAEVGLLARISGTTPTDVAECVEAGVLVGDGHRWSFRHELARVSYARSLSPRRLVPLHENALRVLLEQSPEDHRSIAHHAAECGEHDLQLTHALLASEAALRVGAHREAAAELRLSLHGTTCSPAARADIYSRLSYECYLTDQLPEAVTARQQAMDLYELVGDRIGVGTSQRWVSRLSWFLGRARDSEYYARRAISTLEPLGESEELAMAWSNLSQLHMLSGRSDPAVQLGEAALDLARRNGWREVEVHALNNIGAALPDDGGAPSPLQESLRLALAMEAEEHAARAYTNLGCNHVRAGRYTDAADVLRAGIAYCGQHDLDSWVRYMESWLAVTLAEQGRGPDALELAEGLLAHPLLSQVSRIQAETVAGLVRLREGVDVQTGRRHLDAAARLAWETGQFQRIGPAAAALAEAAWLEGRTDDVVGIVRQVLDLEQGLDEAQTGAELRWWLWVVGAAEGDVEDAPATKPYAEIRRGDLDAAGSTWQSLGCPVRAAYAWGLSPSLESARTAVQIADELQLGAVRAAVLRERQARRLPIPRGPRASSRRNDALLTRRELEVLQCLEAGLTNAEVARELVLSERTVDHHVSAILRKLGESGRGRAVAAARRRGILSTNVGSPTDVTGPT